LDGGVLIVGGDSGVADLYRSNVSPMETVTLYLFATQEAQQINFCPVVAKPDVCAPSIVRCQGWYRFEKRRATSQESPWGEPRVTESDKS